MKKRGAFMCWLTHYKFRRRKILRNIYKDNSGNPIDYKFSNWCTICEVWR